MNIRMSSEKYKFLKVVLSYLFVSVNGLIGLYFWFVYRQLVIIIIVNSSASVWSWRFIDMVTFILYGIVWLIGILVGQYFYEQELKRRWFPHIFMYATGIQIILYVVANLVLRLVS